MNLFLGVLDAWECVSVRRFFGFFPLQIQVSRNSKPILHCSRFSAERNVVILVSDLIWFDLIQHIIKQYRYCTYKKNTIVLKIATINTYSKTSIILNLEIYRQKNTEMKADKNRSYSDQFFKNHSFHSNLNASFAFLKKMLKIHVDSSKKKKKKEKRKKKEITIWNREQNMVKFTTRCSMPLNIVNSSSPEEFILSIHFLLC